MHSQDADHRADSSPDDGDKEFLGATLGFFAFFIWGLFPLYFYYLRDVPPLVTLAFRAVFTTVLLVPIVVARKKFPTVLRTMRNPRLDLGLFVTMATTAASWGLFIWLVAINRTLYASLGNYACPLVTTALGAIIFRERPTAHEIASIALAIVAVAVFALGVGRLPWESVVVAFVFAIYSVLRKLMDVDSATALSVETIFSLPFGIAYIAFAAIVPDNAPEWTRSARLLTLLVGGGVITAVPLLLFGAAARMSKLSTLAVLNYLTPTGQFLCGVYFLHERTTSYQWISFGLIWCALAVFTTGLIKTEHARRRASRQAVEGEVEGEVEGA